MYTLPWAWPLTVSPVCFPGGMSVSQCSKEEGRSSGPSHETAAPKRTYDMMEGRVSRAIASASIEGRCPAQDLPWVVAAKRGLVLAPAGGRRRGG